MDSKALDAATRHARFAKEKLSALPNAESRWAAEQCWSEFLTEHHRAFSKLAAGATGKSAAWFGKIKRDRTKDPLLRYLHQARHAEEHGLDASAQQFGKPREVAAHEARPMIQLTIQAADGSTHILDGTEENLLVIDHPETRLVPVLNKTRWYAPPQTHMGVDVSDKTVAEIGEIGMLYLEGKIQEAREKFLDRP